MKSNYCLCSPLAFVIERYLKLKYALGYQYIKETEI